MRSMRFAQPDTHWATACGGLAAAGAAVLYAAGQGQAALALLAVMGAASAVLFAAGQLQFKDAEASIESRIRHIFGALPAAVAVTDSRGIVRWQSQPFLNAAGVLGLDNDLSKLGERRPEIAAAVFRLFAAARKGNVHSEILSLTHHTNGALLALKVLPFTVQGGRSPLLIWQIEEVRGSPVSGPSRTALLDSLPIPALSIAADLSIESSNKSFERLTGSSPVGKEAWTLFHTRRGNAMSRAQLRDMIAKAEGAIPVQIAGASGFYRPAALHLGATPDGVHDAPGTQLWIVTPEDAGGKTLDDAFEAVLARAPAPMALMNPKGVILAANDPFRCLVSATADVNGAVADLTGKALASFVAEPSSQNVRQKLAEFSAGSAGLPGPVEIHTVLKGALEKRVRLTVFPAANESNIVVWAEETGTSALIDEKAVQSQKLQAVGELAGGIAHDFNNLLTAIIGFSDLLLRRFRASDPAFKDLMNIKNNATRAAELVKQILAYSRRQTLRPALLKLTDVIEEFQATMGRTLGENVKARVQHGRDLWFVKADEGQLFQVIMNLAVNARDAMHDGGEITIKTANVTERESLNLRDRGLDRGEYVMCEVRDSGTGIKPEHIEKIFDPFFSTKEVGKGTGLGLSTVYGIVKQTGGTILVDSEIGVGTSFRIYLPRYVETEEDLKALESKAEASEKIVDLTGTGTVLLVEDEEAVRSFASRALATRGYTVLEAGSGVEALEIMDRENGRVDLVVSDVVMPEMDGPTLLRHLRERNPDIRIIFMSGYAEEAFRKNLSAGEEFVFLPKPFTLKRLAETVKAAAG